MRSTSHRSLRKWASDLFRKSKKSKLPTENSTVVPGDEADLQSQQNKKRTGGAETSQNSEQRNAQKTVALSTNVNFHLQSEIERTTENDASETEEETADVTAGNDQEITSQRLAGVQLAGDGRTDGDAMSETKVIQASEISLGLARKQSIWSQTLQRYAIHHPEQYKLLESRIEDILTADIDNWDTWMNIGIEKKKKDSRDKWLRTCKAYLPRFKTAKALAMSLSRLDPHNLAPYITAGAFAFVELCFETIDPSARDQAMSLLLKTNVGISKWVDFEVDLQRMKERVQPEDLQKIEQIESHLSELYFYSLMLVSRIYKAGQSRGDRFLANLKSESIEWDEDYKKVDNQNSVCSELKNQVEAHLKRIKENIDMLCWIKDCEENPDSEAAHQTVKERTGVNDPISSAGKWFLGSSEFTLWLGQIGQAKPEKQVFWLKGAMGTGKTTLTCRTICHFQEFPVKGVRFIRYYCTGSRIGENLKAPRYETVLRALCRRLAWKGDGSIDVLATRCYDEMHSNPDAKPSLETWKELLRNLVSSSSDTLVFMLDAIDECKEPDDYQQLLKFLADLIQVNPTLYCLISSRPHVRIGDYFSESVEIFEAAMDPHTPKEMARFIKSQIASKMNDVRWKDSWVYKDPVLGRRLEHALLKGAGSMFRWVEIWIGVFFPRNKKPIQRQGYAEKLLMELENFKSLNELPENEADSTGVREEKAIRDAYKRLWDINGDEQYKDLQIRLFRIVTGSMSSLTPQQLLEATCFDPHGINNHEELTIDQLEGLYCNFLKANVKGSLDFEHVSAEIFVSEMTTPGSNELIFGRQKSRRFMAEIAIAAIERPEDRIWSATGFRLIQWGEVARRAYSVGYSIPREREDMVFCIKSDHFASYLFIFWMAHCQLFRDEATMCQRLSKLFQGHHPGLEGWILCRSIKSQKLVSTEYNSLTRTVRGNELIVAPDPFLCMVSFGFSPFSYDDKHLPVLLQGFKDADPRNLDKQTALHVACIAGWNDVVRDLLAFERAKRNSTKALLVAQDIYGRIPLHFAGLCNSEGIAKMLLEAEELEPMAAPDTETLVTGCNLLWKAKDGSYPVYNIIAGLNDDFLVGMCQRYQIGFAPFLNQLLCVAAHANKIQTACYLINKGANVNAQFSESKAPGPLHAAARRGHLDMVDLLLQNGAEIDGHLCEEGTPLHVAAENGDLKMAKLLLDWKANINALASRQQTIKRQNFAVSFSKKVQMRSSLKKTGTPVSSSRWRYRTETICSSQVPLDWALCSGSRRTGRMAIFLLARGADRACLQPASERVLDRLAKFLGGEDRLDQMIRLYGEAPVGILLDRVYSRVT